MNLPDSPVERARRTRERAEELSRAADRATDPEHSRRLREKALRLLGEEPEPTAGQPGPHPS
ncbi:hypothetical protein EES43_29280 [Streptomyces sp. ADI96-02]|uniref:DUF6381 family protein n=1 Tax=unclassified Streptomyces TaxID=2593676 RepID=UPI000F54D8E1|nr:DUF6381 family protein [Streptomyces sp. ADI96-02]RPK54177.1 hypothetical protein EES43_29280 [Streptomyces sp. ADI96-02]